MRRSRARHVTLSRSRRGAVRLALLGLLSAAVAVPSPAGAAHTDSVQLYVSKGGSGAGTVVSDPSGISCGSDCYHAYTEGTVVTLTATPASGSTLSGFTGCDSYEGTTCRVAMLQTRFVQARFDGGLNQGPALVVARPRAGLYLNDQQLASGGSAIVVAGHVTVEVQASNGGATSVQFFVNDAPVDRSQVTAEGYSYRFRFRPTEVKQYAITAVASNGSGSTSVTIHVQGIPAG